MYLYLKMVAKVHYCVKADLAGKPERETERTTRQLDLGSEIRSGILNLGSDLGEKEKEPQQVDLGSEIRSGIWNLGSDLGETEKET